MLMIYETCTAPGAAPRGVLSQKRQIALN